MGADPEFLEISHKHTDICAFQRVVKGRLTPVARARLSDAMDDPDVSAQAIATVVSRWLGGERVNRQRVREHRVGECCCAR